MFGLLRPNSRQLPSSERRNYQASYCNLCASLSRQYGVASRLLLVYDFVSLAWLMGASAWDELPYAKFNCLKGGTLLRKPRSLRPVDEFLAAISVLTCGVKVQDDVSDHGGRGAILTNAFFRKTFAEARDNLDKTGFDIDALDSILVEQANLEQAQECRLALASAPTGRAYSLVARHLAALQTHRFDPEVAARIGDELGRAIILTDAYRDFRQDIGKNYNPIFDGDRMEVGELPDWRRREVLSYILERLRQIEEILKEFSPEAATRWEFLERHLLRALGVSRSSVVLNGGCCIPCGDGFVMVDNAEIDSCCTSCCIVACIGICCCSRSGCC